MSTMTKRDFYEILGVPKNAPTDQIKKAFRNKARHLHPDNMDSGDEAAFKELAAAYEVLSDDNKRALYDRYGHEGLAGGMGGFDGVDLGAFADLSEIFSQFFGGTARGGRRNTVERGSDLKVELHLDFLEAVFGVKKTITIKRLENCTACSGSGAAAGHTPVKCVTCAGIGQIRQATSTFLGQFTQIISCPNCLGEGMRVEKPCTGCKGRAQVRKSCEIELNIPAGIDSGLRLRVPNAGDYGKRNGPPGDVYVVVSVEEHQDFIREGTTIHVRQPVSFSQAALGCEIRVPSVEGAKTLKIPAGTQTGTVLVMKELGVPNLNSPTVRGDQLVHVIVETPTKLSAVERRLLEQLADLRGDKLDLGKEEKPIAESKSDAPKPKTSKGKAAKDPSIIDKLADVFRSKDAADGSSEKKT